MKVLSRLKIESNWFNLLSPEKKREYILEHPDSKYAKSYDVSLDGKEVPDNSKRKYKDQIAKLSLDLHKKVMLKDNLREAISNTGDLKYKLNLQKQLEKTEKEIQIFKTKIKDYQKLAF